jgi:hypothetical protein
MPLSKLPVTGLDDINHRRRARETLNLVLDHQFNDDRVQTAAEKLSGITPVNYAYAVGNVKRYGAKGDGTSDDSAAFNAAATVMAHGFEQGDDGTLTGCIITVPPGQYMLASEWVVETPYYAAARAILGYGAEIFTTGNIYGLHVLGSSGIFNNLSIYGLKINHRGNSNAEGGFCCEYTANVNFIDCNVEAHGVKSTYAAFRLKNLAGQESSSDYGNFWTRFVRCATRKRAGADSGDFPIGFHLQGAANATNLYDCVPSHCDEAVKFEPHSGQTYIPNGCMILGCSFEANDIAVSVAAAVNSPLSGLRIIGNRVETCTTFLSLTGATVTLPDTPIFLAGNYLITDVTNYILNTQNIPYVSLDVAINTALDPQMDLYRGLILSNVGATGNVLTCNVGANNTGIRINDTDASTQVMLLSRVGSGLARITGSGDEAIQYTSAAGFWFGAGQTGVSWTKGSGSPEGVITAPVGSIYSNTSGGASTTLYVKTSGSGNTGWTAK